VSIRERAKGLAWASTWQPDLFGKFTADELMELVEKEIGSLDEYVDFKSTRCKAVAPKTILHVMRGMPEEVALASICRGILLGARNLVVEDINSSALRVTLRLSIILRLDMEETLKEFSETLHKDWIESADVVIAHGSDEVIDSIAEMVKPGQVFIPKSNLVSFSVVMADSDPVIAAEKAAHDICVHDLPGGNAPHCIYVENDPLGFSERLAAELENTAGKYRREDFRSEPESNSAEVMYLCSSYEFREERDSRVKVWRGEDESPWAVIYEEDSQFAHSCLHRVVFVKPMPPLDEFQEAVAMVDGQIASIGLWPFSPAVVEKFRHLGASQYLELGEVAPPSLVRQQDGGEVLAPLVRWEKDE